MHRELHAATRRAGESADSPTGNRPTAEALSGRRRPANPNAPHGGPRSSSSKRPRSGELPEWNAGASPDRPIRAAVTRRSAANVRQAELAVDEIGTEQVSERPVPPPAPKRESKADRLQEPARPTSRQESSAEPSPRLGVAPSRSLQSTHTPGPSCRRPSTSPTATSRRRCVLGSISGDSTMSRPGSDGTRDLCRGVHG